MWPHLTPSSPSLLRVFSIFVVTGSRLRTTPRHCCGGQSTGASGELGWCLGAASPLPASSPPQAPGHLPPASTLLGPGHIKWHSGYKAFAALCSEHGNQNHFFPGNSTVTTRLKAVLIVQTHHVSAVGWLTCHTCLVPSTPQSPRAEYLWLGRRWRGLHLCLPGHWGKQGRLCGLRGHGELAGRGHGDRGVGLLGLCGHVQLCRRLPHRRLRRVLQRGWQGRGGEAGRGQPAR